MKNQKVALITGGAQGIGKGIAEYFLKNKITVIIADSDNTAGKETEKELTKWGQISFIKTHIQKEAEVKSLIKKIISTHTKLDYLINNAGTMIRKPLLKLTLNEWNQVIGVNLTGAFLCSKYAAPFLKKSRGAIVNIASTRALMSEPNTESYSASKGGITALTHALALSLGPEIRVNCVSPGWIEVAEWKKRSARKFAKHTPEDLSQHPAGRVGAPADIAAMVFYLVSQAAGFITGANFIVDGGMTKKMIYV